MRHARARAIVLLFALAAGLTAAPAGAHDLDALLREAGELPEVQRFVALHEKLHGMLDRYRRLEGRAGRARLEVVEAERAVAWARDRVEDAETRLGQRIRSTYQLGPGSVFEAVLGAGSFADVAAISEYASRALSLDGSALREAVVAEAVLVAARGKAEAAHVDLADRVEELRALLARMERRVEEAAELAEQAKLKRELEEQRQAIAELAARQGSWDLGVIGYGQDQSHLLALLGGSGGRTCEIPPGLVETGKGFSGYASWYGWEFGGQPTATGAIFDPRLFTAANRWLPFGTFLRVRRGDRCAIVLVNDRGPYGHMERVIDLSMAAAQHLGVGVSWVEADILLPAEGLPG